ncbi:MAG: CapA family protein [Ruminococcaceae bacterium]|nr:CapA family protein [Oscillospiraceae bacterium]
MKKTFFSILLILCLVLASCSNGNNVEFTEKNETQVPLTNNIQEVPEEKVDYKKISFLGAGDNIVYFGTVRDAQRNGTPDGRKYNFKPIYSEVADLIKNADVSFINQETLMCGDGYQFSYYPFFNGPQDMGHDLVELGFDVVGMANNHMLDKGNAGLEKTIDFWKTLPVTITGGYKTKDDYSNITVHESNGIKIAFLSYTEHTNGNGSSSKYGTYIPYLKNANIAEEVARAKEKADLVFVSVHWGEEGTFKPNNFEKEYAKKFADAGVDVILGHHPHVIQPVEWIEGKNGNKTLCVYSLGNFMAEQAYAYNMVGGMITFDIVSVDGSKPDIENVKFIPTVFDWGDGFYNNKVYLLEKYTSEQANKHGIGKYGRKTSLAQLRGYVSNTINDEFLPTSYLEAVK